MDIDAEDLDGVPRSGVLVLERVECSLLRRSGGEAGSGVPPRIGLDEGRGTSSQVVWRAVSL